MKHKITMIEFLAIIVVFAFVLILIGVLFMPNTKETREKAFRVEATKVIESGLKAVNESKNNKIEIKNNEKSMLNGNKYCFTIEELIDLKIYSGKKENYSGKVLVDLTNESRPQYSLFLKKNDEFKIIGGIMSDYNTNGVMSILPWNDDYSRCSIEDL